MLFECPDLASLAVDVLKQHSTKTRVPVFAFCVMPDHVHLVLSPSPECDLVSFIGQFKNLTQHTVWDRGVTGLVWQKSFWDHFLRADEELKRAVEYVLNNPVRRGIVECWRDYPFCGSLVYNREDLS